MVVMRSMPGILRIDCARNRAAARGFQGRVDMFGAHFGHVRHASVSVPLIRGQVQ
jgi:hypothetical protein